MVGANGANEAVSAAQEPPHPAPIVGESLPKQSPPLVGFVRSADAAAEFCGERTDQVVMSEVAADSLVVTAPEIVGKADNQPADEPPPDEAAVEVRPEGPPVSLGVTEPISLGLPTPAELVLNEQMLGDLMRDSPLESEDGMRTRAEVLAELQRLVLQWIYEVSIQSGMSEASARDAGSKIFTFGSYRLGVINSGSDIDALCVAPQNVTREAFFQVLVPKLREHPDVQDLSAVPDAYTPIIKLKLKGVDIDLLFARLNLDKIPASLESLVDDNLLKHLDDRTVRSLNGSRVADLIMDLVPDAVRYRDALRLIKTWAKKHGIYSNILGFFGGITWAILMARVCQLYPHYCSAALVSRFFRVYDRWNWRNPVMLCPICEKSTEVGLEAFRVWNPKIHHADRHHLMPIITPAFPSMNSTHNVSEATKRILMDEFQRGHAMVQRVERGECSWSEVYRPTQFYSQHKHYLHFEILAKTPQAFTKWEGWIESKLRHLVRQLEHIPGLQVRPWPEHIAFHENGWPHCTAIFFGLAVAKRAPHLPKVDLREPVRKFVELINNWAERSAHAGLHDMRVRHVAQADLPSYVPRETPVAPAATPAAEEPAAKRPRSTEDLGAMAPAVVEAPAPPLTPTSIAPAGFVRAGDTKPQASAGGRKKLGKIMVKLDK